MLLILLGDGHTVKYFQPVLMQVYFYTGLKELAKASEEVLFHHWKTTNFKRTHNFQLQV